MLTIMGHNNDFFKQTGLRIMNGRVGNDGGVGRFTFVGSRGRSLVDNVLPSQNMLQLVKLLRVQEPNIVSDHCLIEFSFECSCEVINNQEHE